IGAPLAPASIVQPSRIVAEQMGGEDQAVRGHSRTARSDERLRWVDARFGEQPPDFLARAEAAAFVIERGEGQVAGARRVARCDSGARIGLASLEAAPAPSVEPGEGASGDELLLGYDLVALLRLEARVAARRFAAFGRAAFGEPLLKAAVEDGDLFGAEMAEHEPSTGSRPDRRIVINDDAVAAADAEAFHRRAECPGGREHVRGRVGAVRQLIDVEIPRPGDV